MSGRNRRNSQRPDQRREQSAAGQASPASEQPKPGITPNVEPKPPETPVEAKQDEPRAKEPEHVSNPTQGAQAPAKPESGQEPKPEIQSAPSRAQRDRSKARPGYVRVKVRKTMLHGGMAHFAGNVVDIPEKDVEKRRKRGEIE